MINLQDCKFIKLPNFGSPRHNKFKTTVSTYYIYKCSKLLHELTCDKIR